ncbi:MULTISPECIES: hypothetical protein [Peribacillus]|uniref:Uncharacterized protein n=1 Tax=Peribacillus castrilensis TaxID=2897690 RepID=A0AAW9NP03_9BACI|nr:hypothetical protein [Peribacillus frigoritolerans]MEC0276474.1 hypothetical protein [Peribacillus castrilensis]
MIFYCLILKTQWIEEYATLLPKNWLFETPLDACVEEALQTVGGKGADFRIQFFK